MTSWGDGSAVGNGPHTYAAPGTYVISYNVNEYLYGSYEFYRSIPETLSITIAATDTPITPLPVGQVNGTAGEVLGSDIPLYSFSSFDADATASDFTASIDWGDGQSSAGTVTPTEQGTFIVSGDHTYDSGGTFPITVLVTDEEGATFAGQNDAVVTLGATGNNFGGYANVDTGSIVLATIADPAGDDQAQPTAVVDWGDGTETAATIRYDDTDDDYDVLGDHVYDQAGTYDLIIEITESGTPTDIGAVATIQPGWTLSGGQLTNSPTAAEVVDLGQAQVALDTGGLRYRPAPRLRPEWRRPPSAATPPLVYNSDTVDVRPIIQAQLASSARRRRPREHPGPVDLQRRRPGLGYLRHLRRRPGDGYLITAQVEQAVAQSGLYPWSLPVVMDFGGDEPEFNAGISGTARVVVNDSPTPDSDKPFESIDFLGAGWGITGIDRLVLNADANGDILWVNGSGDERRLHPQQRRLLHLARPTTSARSSRTTTTPSPTPPPTRPCTSSTPSACSPPSSIPTASRRRTTTPTRASSPG